MNSSRVLLRLSLVLMQALSAMAPPPLFAFGHHEGPTAAPDSHDCCYDFRVTVWRSRECVPALLLAAAPILLYAQEQLRVEADRLPLAAADRQELKAAIEQRRYERAETLLAEEIRRQPAQSNLLALLGEIFFLDGKFLSCATAMTRADGIAPLGEDQRFTLAMAFLAIKRRDLARPELDRLRAANRRNPRYAYWLGKLDFDDQKFSTAVAEFQEAIRLDPGSVKAYDMLGVANQAAGEKEKAEKCFREAVRLNRRAATRSAWPPLDFGSMLLEDGRLSDAETYIREAVADEPGLARAHYKLGLLLELEQSNDAAIRELRTAADLDAADPAPWHALAKLYRRLGREDEAEDASRKFRLLQSGGTEKN